MALWTVAASQDAVGIVNHLDGQAPGLGSLFLAAVFQTEAVVDAQPQAFAVVHRPDKRRAIVHRPFAGYGLYYRVGARGPEILAVLHLVRNPRWIGRTLAKR
jgi:hypothetical protein